MIKFFRKQSFFLSAIILTIGAIIAKVIGAFYKIPLTNILGTNGMGVYYLVFPIYSLFLVLSGSGVSIAVSKLVATERKLRNKNNEIKIFNSGLIISFISSLFFSFIVLVFAKDFAMFQGNANAYLGYMIIAPAIVCASVISIVRGFFQGVENMIPTSLSTIVEQLIKLLVGLFLSYRFLNYGIQYAVFGAILGVTISEIFAMILLFLNFFLYKKREDFYRNSIKNSNKIENVFLFYKAKCYSKKKYVKNNTVKGKWLDYKKGKDKTFTESLKKVFSYSVPATLSSLVIPLTTFLDSFMVINLLTATGFSGNISTSLYGISSGVVGSLVSLPVLLISSLSTAIIPNLSGTLDCENGNIVKEKSGFFIKITWLLALPMFIYFLFYSKEIVQVLFGGGFVNRGFNELEFAYKLMMVASIEIIYYSFLQTLTAILQAINKPNIPMISLLCGLIVRTFLVCFLTKIQNMNVFGVVVANVFFLGFSSLICIIYAKKYVGFSLNKKSLLFSLLAVIISIIISMLIKVMLDSIMPTLFYSIISGGFGIIIYLLLLMQFEIFTEKEIMLLPFSKKIFKRIAT